jgi:hypothetical protein
MLFDPVGITLRQLDGRCSTAGSQEHHPTDYDAAPPTPAHDPSRGAPAGPSCSSSSYSSSHVI